MTLYSAELTEPLAKGGDANRSFRRHAMKNPDPPNSVELLCDCGAKQAVAAPTRYKKCLRCSGRNGFVIPILSRKDCGATLGAGIDKKVQSLQANSGLYAVRS